MANEISVLLGQRIRGLRRKRGWRQIDLAAHAGINKTYICDLERGKRDFCMETLSMIATALDEKPSAILASIGH